jgi:hypothetical protein
MNQVQIGKSSYGKNSGGSHGWFYIEDNKDNIYRVLPPMKSLAPHGKYAKFYKTHRGFRDSSNKQKPFVCIEESNYKTKVITTHCPVCDWVAQMESQVKQFESRGATKEQIKEYNYKNIYPFKSDRKYYLNVVNQENKIGILAISSTMFQSLEALGTEQEKLGRDITGMEGVFINFKKQTKFKGDRDAIHTASLFMQPQADGSYRFVTHTITPDFASRLSTEAADLGNLFKVLDVEQISRLVSLATDDAARGKYVDALFAAPEAAQAATGNVPQTVQGDIPGTNLTAVSRVEVGRDGGFQVQQPTIPANFNQVAPPPTNLGQFQGTQQSLANLAPATPAPAAALPSKPISTLSDEEFTNMVRPINKG